MTTNKIALKTKKSSIFVLNKDAVTCYILSFIVLFIICILIINPGKYNSSILNGLSLFFNSVLPALFPFMLLTKLLTSLGAVKHLSFKFAPITTTLFNCHSISSYVFLMSILSGYPIGAKLISDLYTSNVIGQSDAKKMCTFCTTSGPIFVIGSIGATMFGNPIIGIVLYASHIGASVLCGIIFSGKRNKKQLSAPKTNLCVPENLLAFSMINTIESILLVGAYISIFFLLADILTDLGIFNWLTTAINSLLAPIGAGNIAQGIIGGLLEVTRGCKVLSASTNIWNVCFACFCLSFSGLSIILQSMSFLNKCKIKARYFMGVKFVHAIISFVICYAICKIVNPF